MGRAIAIGLANAGADVVATSRRLESVATTTDVIRGLGRRSVAVTSDVRDRTSLANLQREVQSALGNVDILVNCAGKTLRTPTLDMTEDQWNDILETNLTGTLRACQVFGKPMVGNQSGSIINIASLASFVGFLEVAAYTASKSGVAGLTRALAVEFAPRGVRVNAIAPGLIPTAMNEQLLLGTARGSELLLRTPMHRFGQVDEVVGAAIYLASDASKFTTGTVLTVDGGILASGVNQ
jgi:NAD(P)-dependent dehydrogenase (short-subunit alcohol dehydrogenase family)